MLTVPQIRKVIKTANIYIKSTKQTNPDGQVMDAKEYYIDDHDNAGFTVSDKETEEQFFVEYCDVLGCDSFK